MMEKENVLIVHNYYQIPGGEDTVVKNEKELLEENGHKVTLYVRSNNEIKGCNIIKRLWFVIQSIYSIKTKRDIRRILKEKEIDVVHVHNTFPLISPSVYKAAKEMNKPVIQTVHNFRLLCPGGTLTCKEEICEKCVNGSLINAIKNKCYRNSYIESIIAVTILIINRVIGSYNNVTKYLALTEFNKSKLEKKIEKDKILVKENFSNKGSIDIVAAEKREYFIYLGRLDRLKGIDIVLEAWKSQREKLIIIGAGPEETMVRSYIEDNKEMQIEYLGYKNKYESMKYLSKAKGLIIASKWYEGLPMTIVEAFSLGVPVIGARIGNITSLIKDNETGVLFHVNSPEALKEAVDGLVNNKELMIKLCNKAEEEYNSKYTRDIIYKKLIDAYR